MKTAHILLAVGVVIAGVVIVRRKAPATSATPGGSTGGTVQTIVDTLGGKPAPLTNAGATSSYKASSVTDGQAAIADAMGTGGRRGRDQSPSARKTTRKQRTIAGISSASAPSLFKRD